MRYLNKIIFVNSANISYAEIFVDGNAHITGTQGVGKSTVLRALLFFYNADKQKLGIQSGQKPFDEFYFKHTNSYILYEVMRENGAYTVLVSRYNGRASFRFIDAPYNREWIIDDSNHVISDWAKINERIDKNIPRTARIDSGATYRDIIFGNTHNYKYAKYAIVESSRYQNIPRSIQNVFLNSKLDADFVKNTIIQSMADDEVPIDLTTYRRQVVDFEREYTEIGCWFEKDKDGDYPVRRQAQRITEKGRQIVAFDQQVLELWHQLNYAVANSEEKIPVIESRIAADSDKQKEEEQKIAELTDGYNKEKDSVNQRIGEQKGIINQITAKRKHFEEIKINEKLELAEREPSLKQEYEEKQNLLNDVLKTSMTIEDKYNIALDKLKNEQKAFEISQTEILNRKRNELQQKREGYVIQYEKNRSNITEQYEQWKKESDEHLEELLSDQHRYDVALRELRTWKPKQDERNAINEELQQIAISEKSLDAELSATTSKIEQLTQEGTLQQKEVETDFNSQIQELDAKMADIHAQEERTERLLANYDGSLYEWLTKNVEGWEETIGKVVDEEKVLYAQGLQPETIKNADGNQKPETRNFYGISLNLDNIESTNRTPDEYRSLLNELQKQLDDLHAGKLHLMQEKDKALEKLSKKYSDKINPLRQELTTIRVQASQIPAKRQDLENRLHSISIEEEELIAKEQESRQCQYNQALLKVQTEKDARNQREAKQKKDLDELTKTHKKNLIQLRDQLIDCKDTIESATIRRKEEYKKHILNLKAQQKAELEGEGVDVALVEQYRNTINELKQLLQQIDDNRNDVSEYRGVERDLFTIEPVARKEIKLLNEKLQQLHQRYQDKRNRIEVRLSAIKEKIDSRKQQLASYKDGITQFKQMIDHEHLIPATIMSDSRQQSTQKTCQELISLLRGAERQKRENLDSLKQTVIAFNSHFNPQNAFNFNTTPVTDNDFMLIAANLQDFLDNNKIEDYRRRTSEHYKDILQRISIEVGALMKRRSEVDQVISEINHDFIEKNFAGVIRSIALRSDDSSDRLMRLLISIQRYTEENALSMGEMNLFSGDNRDEVNRKVVDYLNSLTKLLQGEPSRTMLTLADTFRLQFRVVENDNDTGWVERINNVGSDGTDILVKAMVNIMLINVFKKKATRKRGDFIIHCMMDEIGRLHPNNIKGILQFANSRNIYLIHSSPISNDPYVYKYTWFLDKDKLKTVVTRLTTKEQV